MIRFIIVLLVCTTALTGCGRSEPTSTQVQSGDATPNVTPDIQAIADQVLGGGAEVVALGDLARNGTQQMVMVNRVGNSSETADSGVALIRAAVLQQQGTKWSEVLRADEYIKNPKGYLGSAPLVPVTGWRLELKQNPRDHARELCFTPLTRMQTPARTIVVGWNDKVGRYQAIDGKKHQFLAEIASVGMPVSELK